MMPARFARTRRMSEYSNSNSGIGRPLSLLFAIAVAAFLAMSLQAGTPAGAAGANLDQCANDPAPSPNTDGCSASASDWVNGNVNQSKANYVEGDSIPYRMV